MTSSNEIQKNRCYYFWLFASIAFCFYYFYRISTLFPFYFIFDMDQITVLDSILIESNKLPDHYYHTSYGMYFTLVWVNRLLTLFGVSHVVTLETLRGSLNPFNDIVFITQCFRIVTVGTCTSIIFFLSRSFTKIFKAFSKFLPVLIFTFTLIPGMVWHSAMLKSEQYSVFYLLISFLLLDKALDLEKGKDTRYLNLIVFLSGISAGMALITKVQCLFLIALLVLRFFSSSEKDYKKTLPVVFNFLFFIVLMTGAYLYNANESAVIGASGYGLNAFSLFLILLLLAPLFQRISLSSRLDFLKFGSRFFIFFTLGILLSFVSHFTLFTHVPTGLEYLLLDFKVVFLRILGGDVYLSPAGYLERLGWQLKLNPFAVVMILFNGYFWIRACISKKLQAVVFSTLLMSLMFLHLLMIVRNFNSDHLWFDVGLVFIFIIHGSIVSDVFKGFSKKSEFLILGLLLVGFVVNGVLQYQKKIDNLYGAVSQYGFNKRASLSSVYGGNQPLFNQLVAPKVLNEPQRVIFENHADRIQEFLSIAKGIFRSYEVLPAQIGPLSSSIKIESLGSIEIKGSSDYELQNGFIVVPNFKNTRSRVLWSKDSNVDQFRLIEQVVTQDLSETQFAVYTRRDLKVYMIVDNEIAGTGSNPVDPCKEFTLAIDQKNKFCYELTRSQIVDLQVIRPLFFYVKLK